MSKKKRSELFRGLLHEASQKVNIALPILTARICDAITSENKSIKESTMNKKESRPFTLTFTVIAQDLHNRLLLR